MRLEKILWVVRYDSLADFSEKAIDAGCTGVAIRTDNDVKSAIQVFHKKKMSVYGWRWPSADRTAALKEARRVANFYNDGLDGYFIDAEGEPDKPYDWNQNGLSRLAEEFCATIKEADKEKPLGITSHFLAAGLFPKIPWATFFKQTDLYLPQAYWHVQGGLIKHGDPSENYELALQAWNKCGANSDNIVPMAGELAHVTGEEIDVYAKKARAQSKSLHFYTYEKPVTQGVWDAIRRA